MAVLSDYTSGTITLANGSTAVTGTGTLFQSAQLKEGDTLQIQNLTAVIASVNSNTSLTLTAPWTGTSLTDAPYRARFLPDGSRQTSRSTTLIELLSNGVLSNLAELGVEDGKVPVGNAAGEYELIDTDEFGVQDPNGLLSDVASSEASAPYVLGYDATGKLTPIFSRQRFASNTTVYVAPSGDDTAGTGASGAPFMTIGKAISYVYTSVDLNGSNVTIQLADGTYPENIIINGTPVGSGKSASTYPITINGNLTTPANVKIGAGTGTTLQALNGGVVAIGGVRYVASGYANNSNGTGSRIYITGAVELETQTGDHFATGGFGAIYLFADYTILGGAMNHIHASEGGGIYYGGTRVVTLTGTPNFTGQFAGCAFGSLFAMNTTFTGAATGRRFLCHYNGQIRTETNNRFLFPGDVAGVVEAGGMYDYPPYAYVATPSDVSLTNGVEGFIPWTTIITNQNQMWNTSGWFQPLAGPFSLHANVAFQGLTAGSYVYVIIKKNSATYKIISKAASGSSETISLILPHEMSAGSDVYQIFVRYDGTGGKVYANSGFTWASARQL